jgi:hypothetical protein
MRFDSVDRDLGAGTPPSVAAVTVTSAGSRALPTPELFRAR